MVLCTITLVDKLGRAQAIRNAIVGSGKALRTTRQTGIRTMPPWEPIALLSDEPGSRIFSWTGLWGGRVDSVISASEDWC